MAKASQSTKPILKRNNPDNQQPSKCVLCDNNHREWTCLSTRMIRDNKMKAPDNLCLKHCGKKTEACKEGGKYYIIKNFRSQLNLTYGEPDHGLRHFLLCGHKGCQKVSEKWWE